MLLICVVRKVVGLETQGLVLAYSDVRQTLFKTLQLRSSSNEKWISSPMRPYTKLSH